MDSHDGVAFQKMLAVFASPESTIGAVRGGIEDGHESRAAAIDEYQTY
jgi:hypothetical protein